MKSIAFKVVRGGPGYVSAGLVPSSRAGTKHAHTRGLLIGGFLLLATATFVCLMLLSH
jgi:hypothetical protein